MWTKPYNSAAGYIAYSIRQQLDRYKDALDRPEPKPDKQALDLGDRPGYGIPHRPDRYQHVLNMSWPPAEVARELKDRPDAIAVQVRIVFEADGEQWLDGVARRWWRHASAWNASTLGYR